MTAMLLFMEGIVMCFVLLLVCVVGIADGPVGLVLLYENDVQQRVVELGLTTKEAIRRNFVICSIAPRGSHRTPRRGCTTIQR